MFKFSLHSSGKTWQPRFAEKDVVVVVVAIGALGTCHKVSATGGRRI